MKDRDLRAIIRKPKTPIKSFNQTLIHNNTETMVEMIKDLIHFLQMSKNPISGVMSSKKF